MQGTTFVRSRRLGRWYHAPDHRKQGHDERGVVPNVIDQVRITRDGDDAIVEYAAPEISGTRLTIGRQITTMSMSDRDIFDVFNGVLAAQERHLLGWNKTVVEIQPGKRQIEYHQEKGLGTALASGRASEILLCRLPFDRAAHGRSLIRGRHDGCCDCTHCLDEFPPRAFGRRRGAAFVEAAPVFQFTIFIAAEEIGLTDRPVGARHGLGFIVKIGKRKIMRHSKPLHTDKLIPQSSPSRRSSRWRRSRWPLPSVPAGWRQADRSQL
jgi:hypothetical protein